jgi:hypothetical protein
MLQPFLLLEKRKFQEAIFRCQGDLASVFVGPRLSQVVRLLCFTFSVDFILDCTLAQRSGIDEGEMESEISFGLLYVCSV